jgi:hypothetical protein
MDAENEKRVTILIEHPEGKKSPGRPRSRCEDNIKWISRKWSESACIARDGQCLDCPSNYQLLKMELVGGI